MTLRVHSDTDVDVVEGRESAGRDAARVRIYAMRTWGELGNLLAAGTLADALCRTDPELTVDVRHAEDSVPTLAAIGAEIRSIADVSPDPAVRRVRYLALMEEVARRLPHGFERAEVTAEEPGRAAESTVDPAFDRDLDRLADELAAATPDLVIGTKGVVSRLLTAAARRRGLALPVVNFITNHGLLRLRVHDPSAVPLTLVQFEAGRDDLVQRLGCPADRVVLVPPMVAGHQLSSFLTAPASAAVDPDPLVPEDDPSSPALVIFCNRGGTSYLRLLGHLAEHHPNVPVLFIAPGAPELLVDAGRLRERHGPRRWLLVERLAQSEYIRRVDEVGQLAHSLFVSKAGPNTVMEALHFGLPPVVLASGLPTEEWVMELVERERLGRTAEQAERLIDAVDALLCEPQTIAEHKARVRAFAAARLEPARFGAEVVRAVRRAIVRGAAA